MRPATLYSLAREPLHLAVLFPNRRPGAFLHPATLATLRSTALPRLAATREPDPAHVFSD